MNVMETAVRLMRERAEARRERQEAARVKFQAFVDELGSRRAPEDVAAEALVKIAAHFEQPERDRLDMGRPSYAEAIRAHRSTGA